MLLDIERLQDTTASTYRTWKPTLRYVMETEVHVYAFAMAANVLLSFFPFLIVMVSVCRNVLEWKAAEQAIFLSLRDYFPADFESIFLPYLTYRIPRGFQFTSVALLLFTANGVFEPLEVALNRSWGIKKNRSFVRNQLISLGLILMCGTLGLSSFLLTGLNQQLFKQIVPAVQQGDAGFSLLIFKMAALPMTILMLFLVYWLLPNGKVPAARVFPVAVAVGVLLEVLKYLNQLTWPWLNQKLTKEMGPFVHSTSIILWAFLASMVVLAAADWAAREHSDAETAVAQADAQAESEAGGAVT